MAQSVPTVPGMTTEQMTGRNSDTISRQEKLDALLYAARYAPKFTVMIVGLGLVTAVLEGVGLTFIIPIIELMQSSEPVTQADGIAGIFFTVYQTLGIPFTIEYVIGGVALATCLRYTSSFLLTWLRDVLQLSYERHIRENLFDSALETEMEFLDRKGSDNILNAIVTESKAASKVIKRFVKLFDLLLLTVAYLALATWISPQLTAFAIFIIGGVGLGLRHLIGSGYDLGDRVAAANERMQQVVQAGMIGIRDIRVFNLETEIYDEYEEALEEYTRSKVANRRNRAAIKKSQNLVVSVLIFALIYVALTFTNLSFGELGLFLFLMFQLGPKASGINKRFYKVEENLPHLVRTQSFMRDLEEWEEPDTGEQPTPKEVETVEFDDVTFSYTDDEVVLREVDFELKKGEFVAFVGQSGAGKSTIVSLLARYYEPDSGQIRANGNPIGQMDISEWRDRISIVRQNPYMFNDTLRHNLTVGNRDATDAEIKRACEIAKVDQFITDLPNGLDSQLGDDGVRLSGGQKQRVALARAILKDADLLILDEATSDLDSNLEKEVQAAIEAMERDYAIIAIAHRLSTVENADRIYTMEDGWISECGGHDELVESEGKYAELYAIQSGG